MQEEVWAESESVVNIPQIVKQRLRHMGSGSGMGAVPGPDSGAHPDADIVTAFAEGRLASHQREPLLLHFSACADCREVLALSGTVDVTELQPSFAAPRQKAWLGGGAMRWLAGAAAIVVVASAALLVKPDIRPSAPRDARPANNAKAGPQLEAPTPVLGTKSEAPALTATAPQQPHAKSLSAGEVPAPEASGQEASAPVVRANRVAADLGLGLVAVIPPPPPSPQASVARETPASAAGNSTSIASAKKPALDFYQQPVATQVEESGQIAPGESLKVIATKPAAAETAAELRNLDEATTQKRRGTMAAAPAERTLSGATLLSAWQVVGNGKLQKRAAGQSWETAPLPQNISVRCVAALGPLVWVGGAEGALMVSTDDGETWQKITGGWRGDIVELRFKNPRAGELVTSRLERWFSEDGGNTWSKR